MHSLVSMIHLRVLGHHLLRVLVPVRDSKVGWFSRYRRIHNRNNCGRSYYDYGSCDTVRTNRPYYPLPGQALGADDDPRHEDESYLRESAWVKSQVEACACICCHTEQAPMGPSKWATDAGVLWTDTMSDTAISQCRSSCLSKGHLHQ